MTITNQLLDKRDMQLLALLDFDARATLTTLGKQTRLSKQAVDRRIKRLEERGIIQGYYAVIDIAKLGYTAYRIALKLRNFGKEEETALFAWCKRQPNIGWLFSVNGRWDIAITVYAQDPAELYETHKHILETIGGNVLQYNVSPAITIHNYPHKFFGAPSESQTTGGRTTKTEIDDIDRTILKEISDDARRSVVDLGRKIRQQPRTISNRMRKLETEGIIKQYRTKINTAALGYDHHKVFLSIDFGKTTINSMLGWLQEHKNTVFATEAIGLADLEFEAKTKSSEELYQIIIALREAFPNAVTSWDAVIIRNEQLINYYPFARDNEKSERRKTAPANTRTTRYKSE